MDGQWNTAANWVGDLTPGPGDDVILNNSFVAGNYTVTLPAGPITVSINSITIRPAGINFITLRLPLTNTANPGLAVTGPGNALMLDNTATL